LPSVASIDSGLTLATLLQTREDVNENE